MSSVIRFLVKDRLLLCVSRPALYSGGQNYDKAQFAFDDTWAGFIKTASFSRGAEVYHMLLDDNGACILPNEIVADRGSFCVGVFGVSGDVVKTTQTYCFDVWDGAITAYTAIPDPTPDIYAQILASIQSTQRPFPIYVAVTNGTATINAKYNNTQDISYRFGKWNANNLPEFISFAFINNADAAVSDVTESAYHYVTATDYFAPYNVAALNDRDGDVVTSHNYTGGNHIYKKADGAPILTAKNNYLRFYADGSPLVSGGKYCSKVRIEWSNDVMGWNTVKNDGTGRYILTEEISMTFDGVKWGIEKMITSKENSIRIYGHHGLQFSLRYCDRKIGYAKFLGSDACREVIPNYRADYTGVHADGAQIYCDDKLCDTILIADDTNAVQFGMYPCGLGRNNDCKSERSVTINGQKTTTISSAYVSSSKAYFNPIWYNGSDENGIPLGVELKKNESVYLRGFYRFYPSDPSAENTIYTITTILDHVTAKTDNPSTISKRGAAYLYFTADDGYVLPDSITVAGASKSWTPSSGLVLLTAPTKDITVSVTGVPATTTEYTITANLTNLTAAESNPTSIKQGGVVELYVSSPSGYSLPETITVTGATSAWDRYNGRLTLSNPTENVTVTASGVEGETWEIIENPTSNMMPDLKILEKVNYTAKDEAYARFFCQTSPAGATNLKMYNASGEEGELKYSCGKDGVGTWSDEGYRTIKIANASTNENMLTWLTANATKL